MEKFASYLLKGKIHETRNSIIYRGNKEGETTSVIIKILKTKYPTPSELARFKQEYNLIKNLDVDGTIKTFELVEDDNRYAIIEEDFEGISVKELMKSGKIGLKQFLEIAVKVSEILGNIHKNNIIHLDIKPDNILINDKTGMVKITDFGISAALTHANDELYHPDVIEGTLVYMSPEQTGRMNRTIDYRTDLYSLGVTFYEMLTGQPLFKSKDPMEMIHAHIARRPVSPESIHSSIPAVVSEMIMKLLSKNPEERYQNAFGLVSDLGECITQFEKKGKIEKFVLCMHDISNKFIIPFRLFGRENEIESLMSSFESVADGKENTALMVVSGAPGIGKSSLINEIQKPIVARRGYFISGKYEQFRRDKPYSAIIQAFQALIRQLLSESEEKISVWKKELLDALGTSGRVITEVIPEVELIIGEQPELSAAGPEESKNRFNFVFEKFTGVFLKKEHPLTLFIDDVQWADLASLQLLKNILTSANNSYFYLIISYRDNEITESHSVIHFLNETKKSAVKKYEITLGPLAVTDITELIINFLRCSEDKGAGLAALVHKKTGGNPFFVSQFFYTLYNEKMIVLDSALGWTWDAAAVGAMKVTDNIVELLAGKIGRLPAVTREVLKLCSCIGNRFDLETLASVGGTSIDTALSDLTEAIEEGLVSLAGDKYVFHHDRIQEAAYSMVTASEKSELHYRIGKLALDSSDEVSLQKKLFYIVDQMNMGVSLVTAAADREKLARLNLEAGKKAKASAAYQPAFGYLNAGIGLLDAGPWENQYELTLSLYSESSEAAYLMGDFAAMDRLAAEAVQHTRTTLDKVKILKTRIHACTATEDYQGAIDAALPILKMLGVHVPKKPSQLAVTNNLIKVKVMLGGKKPDVFFDRPPMTDPEKRAGMEILLSLTHAAFYIEPNMYAYALLKMLQLAKYGISPIHGHAVSGFGVILLVGLWDFKGSMEFSRVGFNIIEKLGSRGQMCRAIFEYNALVRHWSCPIIETIEPMLEGFRIGMETGDLDYGSFNLFLSDIHSLYSSIEINELESRMEKHNKIIAGMNQKHTLALQSLGWQCVLNIMGKCDDPFLLKGKAIDAEAMFPVWVETNNRGALPVYWFCKLNLYFLYNDYALCLKACDEFKKYSDSQKGVIINLYAVIADSVSRLFMYEEAGLLTRLKYRVQIKLNKIKLKKWSDSSPTNAHQLYELLRALYAWLVKKNIREAEKLIGNIIRIAKNHGDIIFEAISNEYAIKFYQQIGNNIKADECKQKAYSAYSRWGAAPAAQKLLEMYPELKTARVDPSGFSTSETLNSMTVSQTQTLDLSTVIKTSQSLSSEIDLGDLLKSSMKLSIENAGAESGILILEDETNNKLFIEVTGRANGEIEVLKSIPLENYSEISASIVNYVNKTGENIVLSDASIDRQFINDPYIVKNKPRSLMCAQIKHKGKSAGIIYLENNLATNAFTPERIELLQILSSQAAISIENSRLIKHKENEAKLHAEMNIAAEIQQVMLPKNPKIDGFDVTAYMKPADDVGGDYYDVINTPSKDWVVIGDVSGHGVPAGLIMMMVQTAIQTMVRKYPDIKPSELLSAVNEAIKYNVENMAEQKYMTINVFSFDKEGAAFHSGLHQDIMVYRAASGDVERVPTDGIWLSAWDMGQVSNDSKLKLEKDDVLLLYTDGVTEPKNANGEIFTEEKLAGILKQSGRNKTDEIRDTILDALEGYIQNDDVTMVILKKV